MYMRKKGLAQARKQYDLEKKLAEGLLHSTFEERKELYRKLYNQLLSQFPDAFESEYDPSRQIDWLRKFLKPGTAFLEIGPGDGYLINALAEQIECVVALDVASEYEINISLNKKINYKLYNGLEADLPENYFDIVFSNQVFEHLHPDDIYVHLEMVKKALKPGGVYIMITPHKFCGPHDISKYFDRTSTCFHLREYHYRELLGVGKKAGFQKNLCYYQRNKYAFELKSNYFVFFENIVGLLPYKLKKILSRILLPSIMMVFEK
ncbi:MAG: class I SAM-dependent methyltransferase [Candidatus Anammoxibacter sp.]